MDSIIASYESSSSSSSSSSSDNESLSGTDFFSIHRSTQPSDNRSSESPDASSPKPHQPLIPAQTVSEPDEQPSGERAMPPMTSASQPARVSTDHQAWDTASHPAKKLCRRAYTLQCDEATPEIRQFMIDLKEYWTKEHNMERRADPVLMVTFKKCRERMLGFLGFVKESGSVRLTPSVFLSAGQVELYLDYLKKERNLTEATMSNHVTSILYAVKYIHRCHAPKYDGVKIIQQLRTLATQLQRKGDKTRAKSVEELDMQGKWVSWEEFVEALRKQRVVYDTATGVQERASALMDLVLLSIYISLPPARGKEIRTLEILKETAEASFLDREPGKNYVVLRENGSVVLHYEDFKTSGTYGSDQTVLEVDQELCALLKDYISHHRKHLLHGNRSSTYLFLNTKGDCFTAASFTAHLQKTFCNLLGKAASVQVLRSAFVTYAYSDRECTEAMKDSIASALRHSRRQSQRTYDRRSSASKKKVAVEYTQREAEKHCGNADIQSGQFVAVVEESSSVLHPKILLGQVLHCTESDASLLWYKYSKRSDTYCICFDGKEWSEKLDSLVPVEVKVSEQHGHYKLITKPRDIHKIVKSS